MSDSVRISQRAKEQLIWLKRQTGIKNWNVLCRWAFCLSVSDNSPVDDVDALSDSNVEMAWKIFAGKDSPLYMSLTTEWMMRNHGKVEMDPMECVRRHIHRGIQSLIARRIESIAELVALAE